MLRLLILIDCLINGFIGGDVNETMSAHAHRMRIKRQPYWWWIASAIDALFFWQHDHCHQAYLYEQDHGGALWWMPRWLMHPVF